jgi:tetratricopeptide (TPR) repeat protein/tRNA A-37 threonylcarbamoyl transferase component Bud32
MSHGRTDPPSIEGKDSLGGASTLPERPDVLASPQQRRHRQAIEAALFGASEVVVAVGRFRLLDRLGQGGMGTVYAAYDEQLDRKIAVKLLRPRDLDSERLRERMLREARALARLSHPNVVHVYEVGKLEDELFVAMEFCAGPTLKAWLDRDRDWREVVRVFRQAGEGLAAAHVLGIVHRDFKPHNVMFGGDGRVRVLDFGLARLGEIEREEASTVSDASEGRETLTLTHSGALLGTPAYMAPEQLLGKTADARSDQFGYCVALYEGLYGERPFAGETMAQLFAAVTNGRLRDVPAGASVPAWLRKIVLRGLSRNPENRFASMRALLDSLADDPRVRLRRWGAAALLVGLLAGATWGVIRSVHGGAQVCEGMDASLAGVWDDARREDLRAAFEATGLSYAPDTWDRVERRLDDYSSRWVEARRVACEATHRGEQSGGLLDLRMACLDERLLHLRMTVDVLAAVDTTIVNEALQAIAKLPSLDRCADLDALTAEVRPPDNPAVEHEVAELAEALVQAEVLERYGKYEDALRITSKVIDKAKTLDYEPLEARAWLRDGVIREMTADYEGAETSLARAYDIAVAHRMRNEAAHASAELVFVVGDRLARPEEGRRWAVDARPMSKAAGAEEAEANYLNSLGAVAFAEGEYDEALAHLERALAIRERVLGLQHPDVASCLTNLGAVTGFMVEYAEARAYLERALSLYEIALGPGHPIVAPCLDNLGYVAWREGDDDDARSYHERAIAIRSAALGPQHIEMALSYDGLGMVAQRQGEPEDALEFFTRSLELRETQLGPAHPLVARSLTLRGELLREQGHYDDALASQDSALTLLESALGPQHPSLANSLTSKGNALLDRASPLDAVPVLERALAIRSAAPSDPLELAELRFALARGLWATDSELGRARELAELARRGYAQIGERVASELDVIDTWLGERGWAPPLHP